MHGILPSLYSKISEYKEVGKICYLFCRIIYIQML